MLALNLLPLPACPASRTACVARALAAPLPRALRVGGCARALPLLRCLRLLRGRRCLARSPAAVLASPPGSSAAAAVRSAVFDVGNGSTLVLSLHADASGARTLHVECNGERLTLHWGLLKEEAAWTLPAQEAWPAGSRNHKDRAVQSPLSAGVALQLPLGASDAAFECVLFDASGRWFNPGEGRSFRLDCSPAGAPLVAAVAVAAPRPISADPLRMTAEARSDSAPPTYESEVRLGASVRMVLRVTPLADGAASLCIVAQTSGASPAFVHWAACSSPGAPWQPPPAGWSTSPPRSHDGTGGAWNSEMDSLGNGIHALNINLPAATPGVVLVLAMDNGEWLKADGADVFVPVNVNATAQALKAQKQAQSQAQAQAPAQSSAVPAAVTPSRSAPPAPVIRKERALEELRTDEGGMGCAGASQGHAQWLVVEIANGEGSAQKSLMHRFNMAHDLIRRAESEGEPAMVVVYAWMRFFATRQLIWNKSYNIKPREISAAQNALTATLCRLHRERPDLREVVRLTMATVGRGGTGDMGQRIRDEILDIQRRNGAMGGFMEEWHQKLHNNTTPDDVVICEGLLAYLAAGLDVRAYWSRLLADNVTKERLLSFERAIRAEPCFEPDQVAGLTRDLTEYLRTLKAVHSGADLASAADAVLGYKQASSQGVSIDNPPLQGVATPRLRELLAAAQSGAAAAAAAAGSSRPGASADALLNAMTAIVEARQELRPWTAPRGATVAGDRERDVLYLDQGLEVALRTAVETSLGVLSGRPAGDVMAAAGLALESLALSSGSNGELVLCLKEWKCVQVAARGEGAGAADGAWPLRAKAVADRLRLALAHSGERVTAALGRPSRELGSRLNVDAATLDIFSEEVVRGGAAAPLAQLLRILEPRLRELAHLGAWQVISPHQAQGRLVCVARLADVCNVTYDTPTVIVASHVSGDEDIAAGAVAVLTPDAPDVLSHVSVRARNERVLFATVFDAGIFDSLKAMEGSFVKCTPSQDGSNVTVTAADAAGAGAAAPSHASGGAQPHITARPFKGTYALPSSSFSAEVVGGKSRNLNGLRGAALPGGVRLPAGAALTFGSFDEVLKDGANGGVRGELQKLLQELARAQAGAPVQEETLQAVRAVVRRLVAPPKLRASLADALRAENIPMPGEAGSCGTWEEAWAAITAVWASKWNMRAVTACTKAGLSHADLAMAVLVQQVVPARYAFVLHTTNPVSGNQDELYGELVCGMGETLVGAYPGRALSFTAPKIRNRDGLPLQAGPPVVTGYPSKPLGLFLRQPSLIFRSDSNGEDLEGFAGAGLYDSVTMHPAAEEGVDYAADQLLSDAAFRSQLLSRVMAAGVAAELALGGAQDVEGVVTPEAEVVIVQTRPQV